MRKSDNFRYFFTLYERSVKTRMKGSEAKGQVVTGVTFGSKVIELEGMVLRGGIVIALGDIAAVSVNKCT